MCWCTGNLTGDIIQALFDTYNDSDDVDDQYWWPQYHIMCDDIIVLLMIM